MKARTIYHKIIEFREDMRFLKFRILNSDKYHLIKNNKKFKNIHNGSRCFILGNGPSLKEQDLSLLADEYVFTVNQIMRHPDFPKLKTNYHFWADPMFFKIDESKAEDLELLEVMKSVNTGSNKPECFFPIDQKEFVTTHGINDSINVNYFYSTHIFHDNFDKDINYTRNTPGFGTVVQWAITMAVYMGFKDIYLLGCDNTGIIVTINSALQQNSSSDYAYKVTENEKKRIKSLLNVNSLEDYCNSYINTLSGYRKLFRYCQKRHIKLVNCSATTVIDSIPKEKFENVMSRENYE